MKECRKCKEPKNSNDFYGKEATCKKCRNEYFLEYAKKNRKKRREWVRKSISRPEYKEAQKIYMKVWMENNKDKLKAVRDRHKEKNKARDKLRYYLGTGKVVKSPCELCGNNRSQGHHHDYSKPLDVRWLCAKHHMEIHRKNDL